MAIKNLVFENDYVTIVYEDGGRRRILLSDYIKTLSGSTPQAELAAHELLDTGVHGAGVSTLATATDLSGAVSNHAAIVAAHHTKYTDVEAVAAVLAGGNVPDGAITQAKLSSSLLSYIGAYGVGQYGVCLYGT